MMRKIQLFAVGLALLGFACSSLFAKEAEYEWKGGTWVPVVAPSKGTSAGELSLIRQYVGKGRGRKAVRAAKKFLKKYPDHPSREEVMMLAGRAEMERGRYYQGYEWFSKQLREYPTGRYSERALKKEYEIAEAFLKGKKRIIGGFIRIPAKSDGLEILTRIAEQAPGSALAEQAILRIADYHYARGEYLEAAEAYDHFTELFGKSHHVVYAKLQGARAIFNSFEGVDFEETPLVEAEQRFRAIQRSYPAAAKEARVAQVLRRIRDLRAQKAYETAQFYERTRHRKAAVFYYKELLRLYPKSIWAAAAKRGLKRVGPVSSGRAEGSSLQGAGSWWVQAKGQGGTGPGKEGTPGSVQTEGRAKQ